jgi:hypothetical protein
VKEEERDKKGAWLGGFIFISNRVPSQKSPYRYHQYHPK